MSEKDEQVVADNTEVKEETTVKDLSSKGIKKTVKAEISSNYGKMLMLFGIPLSIISLISVIITVFSDAIQENSFTSISQYNSIYMTTIIQENLDKFTVNNIILVLSIILLLVGIVSLGINWRYLKHVRENDTIDDVANIDLGESYSFVFKNHFWKSVWKFIVLGLCIYAIAFVTAFAVGYVAFLGFIFIGFSADSFSSAQLQSANYMLIGFAIGLIVLFIAMFALFYYLFAPIVLYQNLVYLKPELGAWATFKEAWVKMSGHRWEYLVLTLSFIGWLLLCAVPVIGIFVYIFYVAQYIQPVMIRWANKYL